MTLRSAHEQQLIDDLNEVERRFPRRIGEDYAAVTIVDGGLIIWVCSPDAAARAETLSRELPSRASTRVRTVGRELCHDAMEQLFEAVAASAPRTTSGWRVSFEQPLTAHRPRVKVGIPEPNEAAPAEERWAQATLDRYGPDRIVIVREPGAIELPTRMDLPD
jgi:hypothetical protein